MLHFSDIHFQTKPAFRQLLGKRIIGSTNLYLMGRKDQFSYDVQRQVLDTIDDMKPDLLLMTGDLTAQALPSEFELAKKEMAPILDRFPSFVIPGNHDVYTPNAQSQQRIEHYFAKWMHLPAAADESKGVQMNDYGLPTLTRDHVTVVGLNPNRPTVIGSKGRYPDWQLDALDKLLQSPSLSSQFVILATHYPVLDRNGKEYLSQHPMHGVENGVDLLKILERSPVKPSMIIHGHAHRGFTTTFDAGSSQIPIFNAGSCGHAYISGAADPKKRRYAAFNVYNVAADRSFQLERYVHDGSAFVQEQEPYSTR